MFRKLPSIPSASDVSDIGVGFEGLEEQFGARFVSLRHRVVEGGAPVTVFGLNISSTQTYKTLK